MESVEKYEAWIDEEWKELEKIGMSVDMDACRRFYYQMIYDQQLTGLNIKNKTLRSLLSVGYGSERDSSSESDKSSQGSSQGSNQGSSQGSEESYESNAEEWSEVFTKDGHFCVDQILPLLPQAANMSNGDLAVFLQNLTTARLALLHYNKEHKDAPYELVMPVMSSVFRRVAHDYYIHVNFFAKNKELRSTPTDSSPELFFAELDACATEGEDPVLRCCILKPNLNFNFPANPVKHFSPAWVFHPDDVSCFCNISNNSYTDSDDDLS